MARYDKHFTVIYTLCPVAHSLKSTISASSSEVDNDENDELQANDHEISEAADFDNELNDDDDEHGGDDKGKSTAD